MDVERAKTRLQGCYVTVPTMFRDPDLELDLAATRRNVRFLLGRGLNATNAVLLSGGAAGDFERWRAGHPARYRQQSRSVPRCQGSEISEFPVRFRRWSE